MLELRTIDGDTQDVLVDLGFRVSARVTTRLEGVDAPERHTDAGKVVSSVVDKWLRNGMESGDYHLRMLSKSLDKYGRSICDFSIRGGTERLTHFLLRTRLVRIYDGHTARQPWTADQLDDVYQRALTLLGDQQ